MKLFDTHCHIDFFSDYNKVEDAQKYIDKAKSTGVETIVNIGTTLERSKKSVELSNTYDMIYATVGIHPHDAQEWSEKTKQDLENLIQKNDKIVAIGECGLDYFKWAPNMDMADKDKQKQAYREQVALANKYKLPVVIHTREADEDMIELLKQYPIEKGFVLHCYTWGFELKQLAIELGGYIGFTGIVTFPKAEHIRQLVHLVPLNKLLIETDAPFLAPNPVRGKENNSEYILHIAQNIADIKNISLQELADITYENAQTFYKIS